MPHVSVPPQDVWAILSAWQTYLEVAGVCNENTRRQYRRAALAVMADTFRDLRGFTEDDVVTYLATLPAQGQMRGMVLRALKSFYDWAAARGLCENPTTRLRVKKPKLGPAPTLTPEELERLFTAAEDVDPRARAAMELMYSTGARISSLIAVEFDDVTLGPNPFITFRTAKGDRPYGVPLGHRGEKAARELLRLRDYVPRRGKRSPTLVGVGAERFRQWCSAAGAASGIKINPHLLRHVFVSRLAEANVDVRTVMELANWADPSQFRRYAAPSDLNLKSAVAVL